MRNKELFSSDLKHISSCLLCREDHKACDKLLPSCTRCKKNGFDCLYPCSDKSSASTTTSSRGRKSDESAVVIKVYNPSVNSTLKGVSLELRRTLELYEVGMCEICPRYKVRQMVKNMDDASPLERSFLYALQGWAEQRVGSKQLGEISFQHARLLMAPQFDNHMSETLVGVILMHFASYNIAKKNYKAASMFLDLTKYYFVDKESPEFKNSQIWIKFMRIGMNFSEMYEKKGAIGILEFMPYLLSASFSSLGKTLHPIVNEQIGTAFVLDDANLYTNMVKQLLFGKFKDKNLSNFSHEVVEIMVLIMLNGFKLALMCNQAETPHEDLWKVASIICNITKHRYFSYVPHLAMPFVDLALSVHANLALQHEDYSKVFVLMDDLELIKDLNSKYDRIDEHYLNVEKILQAVVSKHTLNDTSTFLVL